MCKYFSSKRMSNTGPSDRIHYFLFAKRLPGSISFQNMNHVFIIAVNSVGMQQNYHLWLPDGSVNPCLRFCKHFLPADQFHQEEQPHSPPGQDQMGLRRYFLLMINGNRCHLMLQHYTFWEFFVENYQHMLY